MRRKTTCKVTFEVPSGHAYHANVRVPYKAKLTHESLVKLASNKTGLQVSSVRGVECADRRHKTFLPHKRRR